MDLITSLGTLMATAFIVFIGCFIVVPTILGLCRFFGLYVIVEERQCLVYVLFGKVRLTLDEPGPPLPHRDGVELACALRQFLRRRPRGRPAP